MIEDEIRFVHQMVRSPAKYFFIVPTIDGAFYIRSTSIDKYDLVGCVPKLLSSSPLNRFALAAATINSTLFSIVVAGGSVLFYRHSTRVLSLVKDVKIPEFNVVKCISFFDGVVLCNNYSHVLIVPQNGAVHSFDVKKMVLDILAKLSIIYVLVASDHGFCVVMCEYCAGRIVERRTITSDFLGNSWKLNADTLALMSVKKAIYVYGGNFIAFINEGSRKFEINKLKHPSNEKIISSYDGIVCTNKWNVLRVHDRELEYLININGVSFCIEVNGMILTISDGNRIYDARTWKTVGMINFESYQFGVKHLSSIRNVNGCMRITTTEPNVILSNLKESYELHINDTDSHFERVSYLEHRQYEIHIDSKLLSDHDDSIHSPKEGDRNLYQGLCLNNALIRIHQKGFSVFQSGSEIYTHPLSFSPVSCTCIGAFLVLQQGYHVLRVYHIASRSIVFNQIIKDKIEGVASINEFFYVLDSTKTLHIFKVEDGIFEIGVAFNLPVNSIRNNVMIGKSGDIYLFKGYRCVVVKRFEFNDVFYSRQFYALDDEYLCIFKVGVVDNFMEYAENRCSSIDDLHNLEKCLPDWIELSDDRGVINFMENRRVKFSRKLDYRIMIVTYVNDTLICAHGDTFDAFVIGRKNFLRKKRSSVLGRILFLIVYFDFIYVISEYELRKYSVNKGKMEVIFRNSLEIVTKFAGIINMNSILLCDGKLLYLFIEKMNNECAIGMTYLSEESVVGVMYGKGGIMYETNRGGIGLLRFISKNTYKILSYFKNEDHFGYNTLSLRDHPSIVSKNQYLLEWINKNDINSCDVKDAIVLIEMCNGG